MSLAIVYSRANIGVEAPLIRVEVHLSNGLPGFNIVGLPETAVKESKERVRSALLNTHLDFPDKKITVNLAPADLPKSGGRYDLAIAIGILAASGQVPGNKLNGMEFVEELALTGEVREVKAVIPAILGASSENRGCIVPEFNRLEAGLTGCDNIWSASHLLDVVAFLAKDEVLQAVTATGGLNYEYEEDISEVIGQDMALRALVVAAAGGHNLLMTGPPGTGKTMLATRLRTILPLLDNNRAIEVAAVRSISGMSTDCSNWQLPPFRSPHHTASAVAMVGGGSTLNVGEITLAHNGVLFLDEIPEFNPKVLEVLREPLESGQIAISRANYQVTLPARFQLIAAMNPCPCGYLGDSQKPCKCTPEQVTRYQARISGPLLDRIDMHIPVRRLSIEDNTALLFKRPERRDKSTQLRELVISARNRQLERTGKKNAELSQRDLNTVCKLQHQDEQYLETAVNKWNLSARSFFRILKMARTVADLDDSITIQRQHLQEAMGFRFPVGQS